MRLIGALEHESGPSRKDAEEIGFDRYGEAARGNVEAALRTSSVQVASRRGHPAVEDMETG